MGEKHTHLQTSAEFLKISVLKYINSIHCAKLMFVIFLSSDFCVPGVHGSDLGHRKCSLGKRSGCSVPELSSLGPSSGQLPVLGLPVFLVLCHHPQHSRAHLPLCQVRERARCGGRNVVMEGKR